MFLKSRKRVFVDDATLWNVETAANIPGFLQRLVLSDNVEPPASNTATAPLQDSAQLACYPLAHKARWLEFRQEPKRSSNTAGVCVSQVLASMCCC